jgi:uncharacterized membrane protein
MPKKARLHQPREAVADATALESERSRAMSKISDLFMAEIAEIRKSWGWFLALGILLMTLGAVCIVKAQTATAFSILVLGWVLVISGVFWLVNAFLTFNCSLLTRR